ncbi:NAD(P)H-dependent oxidoreductase [Ilumatobacter sp.]|uniref:NAD(P)H-dependent oxidoreductase n=1 Tax=Ilumatobacter sp. TaxID=1967498 RepID=UPI003B521E50
MTRALVVRCHPLADSLTAASAERVLAALDAAGARTRVRDLYAEGFVPELDEHEHRRHRSPGVSDDVAGHADDLRWCDTLILVHPTWWSGQPAMLKGWFDRVWAAGVAWELPDGATRLHPLLHDLRRLVVVTTHGSSKLVNALQGEGGKRTVTRSLRAMCHPRARTTWIALYGVDTCDEAARQRFLDRVERRVTAIARRGAPAR